MKKKKTFQARSGTRQRRDVLILIKQMRNIFKVIKLEPVELSCWLKVNRVLLRAQWDLQLEV